MMDFEKLDRICERIRGAFGIPSLSAAFFIDGQIHTCAIGCEEDTLFAIGSCTKSFTAGTLLSLQDRGLLSLDEKLKDRVKNLRLSDPLMEEQLTVRDILCHRSGLPGCDLAWYSRHDDFSDGDLLKAVSLLPKSAEPGEKHQYNNMVYALSGKVIEDCTEEVWDKVTEREILEPLGIRNYAFSAADALKKGPVAVPYVKTEEGIREVPHALTGAVSPAGSLYMTASELLKWNVTLLQEGRFSGKEMLSKAAVSQMEEPLIPDEEGLPLPALSKAVRDRYYGLGLQMETFCNEKLFYHGGAIDGFLANQSFLPCKNCASVLLTDLGGTFAREAFLHAVNGLYLGDSTDWVTLFSDFGKAYEAQVKDGLKEAFSLAQEQCADLPGDYCHPLFGTLKVTLSEKGCTAKIGVFTMPALFTKDRFSFWHAEFGLLTAEIVRSHDGDITALKIPADPTISQKFDFVKTGKKG